MFVRIALALAVMIVGSVARAETTYTVKRGNNLSWIASQNGVGRESLIFRNEELLKSNYDKRCGRLSDEFRTRKSNQGAQKGGLHYCNDGLRRPYANTINPGLSLTIPEQHAPTSIERTVSEIRGNRIAVIIDDTGSTRNKRAEIAEFYLAALKKRERAITGIYLFAGGNVRRIDAVGVTNLTKMMRNRGKFENTHDALQKAAADRPDVIILITDEPGDDWDWSTVHQLPSVIAHCMPDIGYESCAKNLQRLSRLTRGRYIEGLLDSSTARR